LKALIQRTLSFCLGLSLLLTAALAAGTGAFDRTHPYTPFPDMAGHWAEPSVRVCVEAGLMEGVGGRFAPDVSLTNGETAAIAARIRAAFTGEPIPPGQSGQPWHQVYTDYLKNAGVSTSAPSAYATRQGFFSLLAAVLPESALTPINSISALPDTRDPAVLQFYNAGILTGVDAYGTFAGDQPLSRAECAAMTARIAEPSLRRHFIPAGQVPASPYPSQGTVLAVNGVPVTYDRFQEVLLSLMEEVNSVYLDYGLVFDWEGHYNMEGWRDYFKSAARSSLAAEHLTADQAAQRGCSPDELALALFGPPSQAELAAAARKNGMDPADPGARDSLTELILKEKLNDEIALWIQAAQIETTPLYDQIDPKLVWETYH